MSLFCNNYIINRYNPQLTRPLVLTRCFVWRFATRSTAVCVLPCCRVTDVVVSARVQAAARRWSVRPTLRACCRCLRVAVSLTLSLRVQAAAGRCSVRPTLRASCRCLRVAVSLTLSLRVQAAAGRCSVGPTRRASCRCLRVTDVVCVFRLLPGAAL